MTGTRSECSEDPGDAEKARGGWRGVAGAGDLGVAARDSDAGRVLGGGRGECSVAAINKDRGFQFVDLRRGLVAQKRPVYENDRHEMGVMGC